MRGAAPSSSDESRSSHVGSGATEIESRGEACDAGSNEGAEERRERRGMASRVRILADRRWAGFGDALAG